MKLLILGGTVFVGRHIVEAALLQGYDVTLFNRGKSNPGLYPDVEKLIGDRDGDLEALKGRQWDVVIDTCGYVPRIVQASTNLLAPAVGHYIFISTVSVYADFSVMGIKENDPVGKLDNETVEEVNGDTYGPLKALCEQVIQEFFPDNALIIRPGLIVGPYDPTDRFTYWPQRIAQGGEVLAPGKPNAQVQIIDARDLADWIVRMLSLDETGVFNAVGPDYVLTMQEILETSKRVSGSDAEFVWAREDFLLEQGVKPWSELPLWLPGEEYFGLDSVDNTKSIRAGLTFRSLEQTIGDTLGWVETRPDDLIPRAGISRQREVELLEAWRKSKYYSGARRLARTF
jgi:2'-hydroxyisoflavone reductase